MQSKIALTEKNRRLNVKLKTVLKFTDLPFRRLYLFGR